MLPAFGSRHNNSMGPRYPLQSPRRNYVGSGKWRATFHDAKYPTHPSSLTFIRIDTFLFRINSLESWYHTSLGN